MGRWRRVVLVVGAYVLLALVLVLGDLTGWGDDPQDTLRLVVYALAYTALVGSVATACARHPRRRSFLVGTVLVPWAVYAVGDLVSDLSTDRLHGYNRQLADAGDALMLGAYALALTSLLRAWLRARRTLTADQVLDGCVLAVALATITWVAAVAPGLRSPVLGAQPQAVLVCAAFPAADLLLVVLGVSYLANQRPPSWPVVGGVVCAGLLLWADALDFYNLVARRHEPLLAHVLWVLGYGAAAAAAQVPPGAYLGRTSREVLVDRRGRPTRLYALGVVPLLTYAWELTTGPEDGVPDALALSVASLLMFVLLVARAAATLRTADEQSSDLAALARSDHLTGLPNRRTADAELSRALARVAASGEPLVVAMLDLDRFKSFNDTFGHHAGDELLTGCAERWGDLLGPAETLARYGGEEFLLITVGLPAPAVVDLLDRLREATPRGQSFSAGLAVWRRRETPAELVSRADEALYAAKDNGRARTYQWEDEPAADPSTLRPPVTSGTESGAGSP